MLNTLNRGRRAHRRFGLTNLLACAALASPVLAQTGPLDANGDGMLSEAEFARYDSNGDGMISKPEYDDEVRNLATRDGTPNSLDAEEMQRYDTLTLLFDQPTSL